MKTYKIFAASLVLTLLFPFSLRAEWFDGEVQKVDTKARTITISEIDPITDTEDKKEILIEDKTVFSGVKSLKDIHKNDNVTIETQYDDAADVWKAVSIEVAEAGS